MENTFSSLCTPAKIYLIIAVITSIIALFSGITFLALLMKIFFITLWTYFLGWLCKKGYTGLSWFLVLLPYIVIFIIFMFIMYAVKQSADIIKQEQNQNQYYHQNQQNDHNDYNHHNHHNDHNHHNYHNHYNDHNHQIEHHNQNDHYRRNYY